MSHRGPNKYELLKDRDWLIDQYVTESKSLNDIKAIVGCSKRSVCMALDFHNIPRRDVKEARRLKNSVPELWDKEFLEKHYRNEGLSCQEIGELIGVTRTAVLGALKRAGIKVRTRGNCDPDDLTVDRHHNPRKTEEYAAWALNVKKRDRFACRQCGSNSDLVSHHIESYRDYPELRLELDNGMTLCRSCHAVVHKTRVRRGRD